MPIPTKLNIRGEWLGRPVKMTWTPGKLEPAEPEDDHSRNCCDEIRLLSARSEGEQFGAPSLGTTTDHLANAYATSALCGVVLDEGWTNDGRWPRFDQEPGIVF